jgi:hypothetical protein
MDNYFSDCQNVNEVKRVYKALLFKLHPDLHDQSEFEHWNKETRRLNEQYQAALQGRHGETSVGDDGKQHTYHYDERNERYVAEKLAETLSKSLPDSVTIWLIGTWIWIEGTQKDDLETRGKLNDLGYRWHSKRGRWYWKNGGYRRRYSGKSFDSLKNIYGARKVDDRPKQRASLSG